MKAIIKTDSKYSIVDTFTTTLISNSSYAQIRKLEVSDSYVFEVSDKTQLFVLISKA